MLLFLLESNLSSPKTNKFLTIFECIEILGLKTSTSLCD